MPVPTSIPGFTSTFMQRQVLRDSESWAPGSLEPPPWARLGAGRLMRFPMPASSAAGRFREDASWRGSLSHSPGWHSGDLWGPENSPASFWGHCHSNVRFLLLAGMPDGRELIPGPIARLLLLLRGLPPRAFRCFLRGFLTWPLNSCCLSNLPASCLTSRSSFFI